MVVFISTPVDDQAILCEWVKPRPVASAPLDYRPLDQPALWAVISTATSSDGTGIYVAAWRGDVPLVLDGAESNEVVGNIKRNSRLPVWTPPTVHAL